MSYNCRPLVQPWSLWQTRLWPSCSARGKRHGLDNKHRVKRPRRDAASRFGGAAQRGPLSPRLQFVEKFASVYATTFCFHLKSTKKKKKKTARAPERWGNSVKNRRASRHLKDDDSEELPERHGDPQKSSFSMMGSLKQFYLPAHHRFSPSLPLQGRVHGGGGWASWGGGEGGA